MLKRLALALALVMAMALPAAAASNVNGIYVGAKFIDSIFSTGSVSSSGTGGEKPVDSVTQNTVGGGIFVGYDFYPKFDLPLRAELEYAIRTQASSSKNYAWGDAADYGGTSELKATWNVQTLMANFYFDFHNSTAFTPYIGAGAGLGFINNKFEGTSYTHDLKGATDPVMYYSTESSTKDQMNTVFAWNVGAGCSYAFNENISADLAYRFVGLGYNEVSDAGTSVSNVPNMHEFTLGIRFTF